MKEIVASLPKDQIIAELTPEKLLRKTNKGGNEIYVITHLDSPSIMHEIGRLGKLPSGMQAEEPEKKRILMLMIFLNILIDNL
jgi:hypothetical protein